jgi:hypothetical protein
VLFKANKVVLGVYNAVSCTIGQTWQMFFVHIMEQKVWLLFTPMFCHFSAAGKSDRLFLYEVTDY